MSLIFNLFRSFCDFADVFDKYVLMAHLWLHGFSLLYFFRFWKTCIFKL